MDPSGVKRRLTCILAADAAGYSKQMGQDEEGTIRVLSTHRAVIDGIIAASLVRGCDLTFVKQ